MQRTMNDSSTDAAPGLVPRDTLTARVSETPAAGMQRYLLQFNLGNFRIVNELYGPRVGDEHLQQVGRALTTSLPPGGIASRLWSDEFLATVDCDSPAAALDLADKLRRAIVAIPFTREGDPLHLTTSVGVAPVRPGEDPERALAAAALACETARRNGRNRVHLYDESAEDLSKARRQLAAAVQLGRMLTEERLQIFAQPIVLVSDPKKVVKLEVLLRIPEGQGRATPELLIAAAERFRLMPSLDRYVFTHALEVLKGAPQMLESLYSVSINLSGQSVVDRDFVDALYRDCRFGGVDPHKLCFEITETAAIQSLQHTRELLRSLRELGCRFSLDDFGAGLCSFGYLRTLEVDEVKIDGQFVRRMATDPVSAQMVRAIHQIAHATGKKTIAEFVENEATLAQLREMGIDYGQGWLFGKAIPLAEMPEFLAKRKA
jgi:diguanylate cyclase (GGDEF)-like protein